MLQEPLELKKKNVVLIPIAKPCQSTCSAAIVCTDPSRARGSRLNQRSWQIGIVMLMTLIFFSSSSLAEIPSSPCRLLISKRKIYPGSVFLAESKCSNPISRATGTFCQHQVAFFPGKTQGVNYA